MAVVEILLHSDAFENYRSDCTISMGQDLPFRLQRWHHHRQSHHFPFQRNARPPRYPKSKDRLRGKFCFRFARSFQDLIISLFYFSLCDGEVLYVYFYVFYPIFFKGYIGLIKIQKYFKRFFFSIETFKLYKKLSSIVFNQYYQFSLRRTKKSHDI